MTTRHLVDPELLPLLDRIPPIQITPETLPQIRAMRREANAQMAAAAPAFPDVEVEERRVPGPDGAPEVRVLIYLPKDAPRPLPALLWIHGGGYVFGSADGDDAKVKEMVSLLGCAAVSVDYRLAPETPHPGPVEDCYAALTWLHANAAQLGVDTTRIAIGGKSAGGGLAAGLGLLTRDRGEVPLVFQLLIYPMLDDRTAVAGDPHPHVGEFVWTPEANLVGWTALLGKAPGGEGVSPYAAAARAESVAGLPATFISVGALDLFVEENLEYARRLMRAGVPTELHVYPGAFHGFSMLASAQVSQAYHRDLMDALRRALHPRGAPEPEGAPGGG
ncbi:alpha/beta hydrolase [Chondromyces apiculatus]|uniref:Esterase/lipase/thioesterase n=1 Tax=Chondromyces apiculatus DSM 436 TaxID=1192034 RepID=A0A017TD11_9BACT|nr:alpha/beta hydrolase [Chondromyces apiculatus]EYF07104.1 esterase/lipase/thioesterase [Chondromyces apiculatus DSM 436]